MSKFMNWWQEAAHKGRVLSSLLWNVVLDSLFTVWTMLTLDILQQDNKKKHGVKNILRLLIQIKR